MKLCIVLAIACFLSVGLKAAEIPLDYEQTVQLVRVARSPQKIDISGGAQGSSGYLRGSVGGDIWKSNNGEHKVSGQGYYQRNFHTPGPKQNYGGNVDYTWQSRSGNHQLSAGAQYNANPGMPRPDYGANVRYTLRF